MLNKNQPTYGTITDIRHFGVHDGPGIRTVFFLKGCPLRCIWCHNPETYSQSPQLAFYSHLCIQCGGCVSVCANGVHSLSADGHKLDRKLCTLCGKCTDVCPKNALKILGTRLNSDDLIKIALEDSVFFQASGGGITLSGGEPLFQPKFSFDVLCKAKEAGINTAVDTCGAVSQKIFEEILPFTDIFLYDIKHIDTNIHRKLTGLGNEQILDNLRFLSQMQKPVEIRIPLIPGCNDSKENIRSVEKFLAPMKNITQIKYLPYHDMARSKYKALGLPDTMPEMNNDC